MQRLDILIRDARAQTGNLQYTATQGIRQSEFVRYANDAQMRLYNRILQERSSLYTKVGYLDVVAGQAVYTLPTDIFLKHNVVKVDYSPNGDARNYSPLTLRTPRQEVSAPGYPSAYFLRQGQIVLSPIPTQSATAGLRLNYQYVLPTLDIRRGQIDVASVIGSDLISLDLALATVSDETQSDLNISPTTGWPTVVDYISTVDSYGTITSPPAGYAQPYGAVFSASVYQINFVAGGPPVGTTIASNWVCFGQYATTHSQLPDVAERYLVEYMAMRIQMRDSNTESINQSSILRALEDEIIDSIANLEEDLVSISILDSSMMNYADDL